jgi:hypothetical protein
MCCCSNQVLYVPDGTKYSVLGPKVRVHYVRTPLGGFQHTLSEFLVMLPAVIPRVIYFCGNTRGKLLYGVLHCDAYSCSWQDFLALGAI